MCLKTELNNHIFPNGTYVPQKALPRSIKSKFPDLYKQLSESGDFLENLYNYINDVNHKPGCLVCGSNVKFKSFIDGYREYCSNTCVNIANSKSESFRKAVSNAKKNKYNSEYYLEKYGDVIEKNGENLILTNEIFINDVAQFISSFCSSEIISNYRINNQEIDIYIPELNLGIECNGLYWHSEQWKNKNYHQNKKIFFKENGIDLIYIWEDEWRDKKEIVKSILKHKLGYTENTIYGRKCTIKEINNKLSNTFFTDNHLQGTCVSTVRLGLFYNNELIAAMTFGKRNIAGKHVEVELLRYANRINYNVMGGAGKLFNFFRKMYESEAIISYANYDISNGNLYKQLGFKEIHKTEPGYWWSRGGHRYHRSNFMKHLLVKQGYPSELSGDDIMRIRGFVKIYNSGNLLYKFT